MNFRNLLAMGVITTLVCACSDPGHGGDPGRGARPAVLVVTEQARIRPIRSEAEAIGTARANESVTLTAKVTDTVSRVNFDDGDTVRRGDVLLELTSEEETALLAEARANLEDARTQFNRLKNLLKQHTVSQSDVDAARARFAAEDARYQSVVARLADRLIRAPFSGVLGFRQVSEGTLISPGTAITTLDDVSVIKLDFSLPETYLKLLRPGLALQARSVAYPDRSFDATVRTINSRVDPVTRTATVRAHIDNPDLLLRPGMLLTVRLTTEERTALMVPEDALIQRGDQDYVYRTSDGVANLHEVTHGDRYRGWVEITSGLEPGDEVVTEGVVKLRPGARIRVAGQTPPLSAVVGGDPGR